MAPGHLSLSGRAGYTNLRCVSADFALGDNLTASRYDYPGRRSNPRNTEAEHPRLVSGIDVPVARMPVFRMTVFSRRIEIESTDRLAGRVFENEAVSRALRLARQMLTAGDDFKRFQNQPTFRIHDTAEIEQRYSRGWRGPDLNGSRVRRRRSCRVAVSVGEEPSGLYEFCGDGLCNKRALQSGGRCDSHSAALHSGWTNR